MKIGALAPARLMGYRAGDLLAVLSAMWIRCKILCARSRTSIGCNPGCLRYAIFLGLIDPRLAALLIVSFLLLV